MGGDALLCTVGKTCTAGACQGGAPKDCSGMTQGCNLGVCDLSTGQCFAQPVMNNDPCDDLNPCTSGEICSNGACGGGAPVTACTMGDSCCPMGCTVQNDADCAITDLALPTYQSTFSSTLTRGYWFTAPVSFTIKELRVPSDVGNDVQNLQVVKFTNGLPTTNTTAHVTLHYSSSDTGREGPPGARAPDDVSA